MTEAELQTVREMYRDACYGCSIIMRDRCSVEKLEAKGRMYRYDLLIRKLLEVCKRDGKI